MGIFSGKAPKIKYTSPYAQLAPSKQAQFTQGAWLPAMGMPPYMPVSYGGQEFMVPNPAKWGAVGAVSPMFGITGGATAGQQSPFASMMQTGAAMLPFLAMMSNPATAPAAIPYAALTGMQYGTGFLGGM